MRESKRITDYWYTHYVNHKVGLCSLCGNSGRIDTRSTAISAAGVPAGKINYCICPNGQTIRPSPKSKGDKT